MIRLIRAFAWLRWRIMINTLRGGRRRDVMEQVSRVMSIVLPIVLGVMLVPMSLGLGAAAAILGWRMGSAGAPNPVFLVVARTILGGLTVAIVISPIVRSIQNTGTGATRLTLLPIPRRLLHAIEVLANLADPWIVFLVPALLLLPAGLLFAGAIAAAAVSLAGALLLLGSLLVISAALSALLQWVYRSRRRGELVTLLVLFALSLSGFLPMLLGGMDWGGSHGRRRGRPAAASPAAPDSPGSAGPAGATGSTERGAASSNAGHSPESRSGLSPGTEGQGSVAPGVAAPSQDKASLPSEAGEGPGTSRSPGDHESASSRAAGAGGDVREEETAQARKTRNPWPLIWTRIGAVGRVLPSEMYVRALAAGMDGRIGAAAIPLAALAFLVAALYTVSWVAYRRVLETPAGGGSRRGAKELVVRAWSLPGLGQAASAVAVAHVRSLLRTVQGKMLVLFSPLTIAFVGVLITRAHPLKMLPTDSNGSSLVWFAGALSLLSMQKILLNQFSMDGPGLTMQFLSPVSNLDLIKGKAAGTGVLFAGLIAVFTIVALSLAPGGSPFAWAAPILGALAAYLPFAPIAAMLAALFPRAADLNRMGSGANPSGAASMLGMLATGLCVAPPVLLAVGGTVLGKSPLLALALVAGWTVLAALLAIPLNELAAAALGSRRENLAMVAQGR